MKKLSILFVFICLCFSLLAQTPAKYWVQFTDKNGSKYSVSKPEEFLSPRAVEKRQKFNIAVTEDDLPVNQNYIEQILAIDASIVLHSKSKWLNGITIYCTNDSILSMLKKVPFVKFAEITIKQKESEKRDKIEFYQTYGQNFAKPLSALPVEDLPYGKSKGQIFINNAQWLHRLGFRGEGVLMMVLDGGFHNLDSIRHFNRLRNEGRIFGIRNFVEHGINMMKATPERASFHGTSVISCIASEVPGELIGTAPKVSFYIAQTEDGNSENKVEEDNWVAGIEWADSLGCDVLNSSLGYTRFDDPEKSYTAEQLDGTTSRASIAATMGAERGIIVCIAAGNEGKGAWKYNGTPSDAFNVLAVGGVDINGKRASFSSYNSPFSTQIKPDCAAMAEDVWCANNYSKTAQMDGTSFASPLMAGMAACLMQAFPQKNASEIMQAIRMSGSQAQKPDNSLGYGIADMFKAYNLLLNAENRDLKINFNKMVLTHKPFVFSIDAQQDTKIKIVIVQKSASKTITKNINLNKGDNTVIIKELSKLSTDRQFDFIDMKIIGEGWEKNYLLGLEK